MGPAGKIAFLNIVVTLKKYHYQFVFAENAAHVDHATKEQTLPEALEYVWQGYKVKK